MTEIKVPKVGDEYKHNTDKNLICTVVAITNKSVIYQKQKFVTETILCKSDFNLFWTKIKKKIVHTRTLMWFKDRSGKIYLRAFEAHELVGWLNTAQRNMWTILKQEEISFEEEVD